MGSTSSSRLHLCQSDERFEITTRGRELVLSGRGVGQSFKKGDSRGEVKSVDCIRPEDVYQPEKDSVTLE